MEKVFPLQFVIDKNNWPENNNQIIQNNFAMNDFHYIMDCIRNIYSQSNITQNYPENTESTWTKFIIPLEWWWKKTLWNLKKYWWKLICPVSLDDDDISNIVYAETEKYSVVCLNVICCEDLDKNEDWRVLNKETWEERLPLELADTFSRTFKCWFAISKYSENNWKRFSWLIFWSKKWLHWCVKAWAELLKKIFETNDFKFKWSIWFNRQRLKAINHTIKEMVITKNIQGKTMWWWTEEELTLELCVKWKPWFNIENLLNKLLGRDNLWTENLEILDQFWDNEMSEENVTIYAQSWNSKWKKLGVDIEWDEFITFSSQEIGSSENGYSLEEYKNLILEHLDSLAND